MQNRKNTDDRHVLYDGAELHTFWAKEPKDKDAIRRN